MVANFNTRPALRPERKSALIARDVAAYEAMRETRPLRPPPSEIPHRNVRAGVLDAAKWREKQIVGYVDDLDTVRLRTLRVGRVTSVVGLARDAMVRDDELRKSRSENSIASGGTGKGTY